MMKKRILFLTGTRADFGKMKSLIACVRDSDVFEYGIFVTGMHMMSRYGLTANEIEKSGFSNTFMYMNQSEGDNMDTILANTIIGLGRYLDEYHYDLIIVHGDRVEALAGATTGALRNIRVAHIEGGEVSGTIDELLRHAVTKMSHIHFVASDTAKKRLIQLGEPPENIFMIGSPDIDVMLSDQLPTLAEAQKRYEIDFDSYAIAMLHPVTTEQDRQAENAHIFVDSLIESGRNYLVIYPNNDLGSQAIFEAYKVLQSNPRFRIFPSIRFEHFLTLLKHADFLIGNSSAGIHEAPVYAVPTVNIGMRQHNRITHDSVHNTEFDKDCILATIGKCLSSKPVPPLYHYGKGGSAQKFLDALLGNTLTTPTQKHFKDVPFNHD